MKKTKKNIIKTQIKDSELVYKRHEKIASQAYKLFVKKGYFQTSIREISTATGLSMGSLYDYITKKEDVLYLVFETFYSVWEKKIEEGRVFEIEDPIEQLKASIRKLLEFGNDYPNLAFLMYTESKSLPRDYLGKVIEKEIKLIEHFEKILKRGIKKGVFKKHDTFLMSNIICFVIAMKALRKWNLRRKYNFHEEINQLIEQFILEIVLKDKE